MKQFIRMFCTLCGGLFFTECFLFAEVHSYLDLWEEDSASVALFSEFVLLKAGPANLVSATPDYQSTPMSMKEASATIHSNMPMKAGVKVGMILHMDESYWNSTFSYRWFGGTSNHALYNAGVALNNIIPTYKSNPTSNAHTVYQVESFWKIDMNKVEGVASLPFATSQTSLISPLGGIVASWTASDYYVDYRWITTGNDIERIRFFEKFSGVGPIGGTKVQFLVTDLISLFGETKVSALWSQNKTHIAYTEQTSSQSSVASDFDSEEKLFSVRSMLSSEIGITYTTSRDIAPYHIMLAASWYMEYWKGFFAFAPVTSSSHEYRDFFLQGAKCSTAFYF